MAVDFPWLWETLKPLGIAGMAMFMGLWWLTRVELLKCQGEGKVLHTQTIEVTRDSANSHILLAKEFHELRDDLKESDARLIQIIRLAIKKAA